MSDRPRGLPGGIALPAVVLVSGFTLFAVCWRYPDLIDLGPSVSASGMGVLIAAASSLWLLVAIAKRPPPSE